MLVVVGAPEASAQVSAVGKGFLIDEVGSLTSNPNEVISGRTSIKASYSGADTFTQFLFTDPFYIRFARGQTYTITLSYRILAQGTRGFEFGFFSPTAVRARRFLATGSFGGAPGTSGTASVTVRLDAYDDYEAGFKIEGTGAATVDDIRITDGAGQLVVSENAEGPTIVPGPWNLQLTDAVQVRQDVAAFLRSVAAKDLDGDGYPEAVLTLSDTDNNSRTPLPVVVVQGNGRMRVVTSEVFPAGIPTVKHSPMTLFADLNGDALQDVVFSEAGGDPYGAGRISVALNQGGGRFRDVSSLVPADQQNTRSYSVVVGDVQSDGQVRILLPDEEGATNTALLRWNGNGFDQLRNWIPESIWRRFPFTLHRHSWMNLADLDNDGRQDLLVSGQQNAANIRLVFGDQNGFASATSASVVTLPDGPWGHFDPGARPPAAQGAEVQPVVVADFNNDGLADIFASERKVVEYQPGAFTDTTHPDFATLNSNGGTVYTDGTFQVLMNQGARTFADATVPNYVNLGNRTYFSLLPGDVNNDGFLDIVGAYQASTITLKSLWGTTFFLNDGTGRFQPLDGTQLLGATTTPSNGERFNLGSFVPTMITPQRIEGIVAESVGFGCNACTSLNIYKVVGNGSLGTGPNFADAARLGVEGFNELFYLNEHPVVAAAVRRGEYRSGLDHYLIEGRAKGYPMHAPNARGRR